MRLSACASACCLRFLQIYLYRNGDKHHGGEEMTLNPKLVKNLEQVMDKANGSVKLVTGGENEGGAQREQRRADGCNEDPRSAVAEAEAHTCVLLPGAASATCSRAKDL